MDAVHQKLGDLRTKLDTVPVLQQAEVSYYTVVDKTREAIK